MKVEIEQDATARKITQEQLLRENARLRGDLRTPLGGIVNIPVKLSKLVAPLFP